MKLRYQPVMTNKELLDKVQEVIPDHVRTLTFMRHQSHCVWWSSHEGCTCRPVFLIEVYTEVDGTVAPLNEVR